MSVLLASSSRRRRELLARLDVPFRIVPSEAEEGPPEAGEDPASYAVRMARHKAADAARRHSGHVVLAADTVVAVDRRILGKPDSVEHAVEMLLLLRGRTHLVATGVAVRCGEVERAGVEQARVRMREFSRREAERYVATGEPMDKAGAYAVQGLGGALVEEVIGCYPAVVGLPLCLTADLLTSCGVAPGPAASACEHHPTEASVSLFSPRAR